jgi:hypothetical protein
MSDNLLLLRTAIYPQNQSPVGLVWKIGFRCKEDRKYKKYGTIGLLKSEVCNARTAGSFLLDILMNLIYKESGILLLRSVLHCFVTADLPIKKRKMRHLIETSLQPLRYQYTAAN